MKRKAFVSSLEEVVRLIGERLYELRKDANLTQDQLADILKINKHSVSSYERDKSEPPDAIKVCIAKYFNVSVDYLLGLTQESRPLEANEDYMRLPADFPKKKLPELKRFAIFLTCEERQKK